MGDSLGLFAFHLRLSLFDERFQPLKSRLAAIKDGVDVPLGYREAGVSRQLHDCKCIRSSLSQASTEGVAEPVQDELTRKHNLLFPVHHWLELRAMAIFSQIERKKLEASE